MKTPIKQQSMDKELNPKIVEITQFNCQIKLCEAMVWIVVSTFQLCKWKDEITSFTLKPLPLTAVLAMKYSCACGYTATILKSVWDNLNYSFILPAIRVNNSSFNMHFHFINTSRLNLTGFFSILADFDGFSIQPLYSQRFLCSLLVTMSMVGWFSYLIILLIIAWFPFNFS